MLGDTCDGSVDRANDWHASTEFELDYVHAEERVRSLWERIRQRVEKDGSDWMKLTIEVEEQQWGVIKHYHQWGARLQGQPRIDFEERRLVYRCLCGNHVDGAQDPISK